MREKRWEKNNDTQQFEVKWWSVYRITGYFFHLYFYFHMEKKSNPINHIIIYNELFEYVLVWFYHVFRWKYCICIAAILTCEEEKESTRKQRKTQLFVFTLRLLYQIGKECRAMPLFANFIRNLAELSVFRFHFLSIRNIWFCFPLNSCNIDMWFVPTLHITRKIK